MPEEEIDIDMSNTNKRNSRRKPKQNKGALAAEITVILIFAVIAIFVAVQLFYRPPVDATLPFDTDPVVTTSALPETDENGEPIETDISVINPDPVEYVRREGVYNFLIAGHDRVAVNTDVIIIASFDTQNNSLNLVQIPRDSYSTYAWKTYHKINGVYSCALNQYGYTEKDAAMKSFMDYLMQNLAIKLDYYVLIDLTILREMVDLIGGVELNVPADMEYFDEYQNLNINLKAGLQTLNGEQAEQFVRFRSGYVQADIGRNDAQKIFMAAFLKQYKENLNLTTLTGTVEQMIKNVTTNLSVSDCVFFAKEALELDLSKVVMVNMPGSDILVTEGEYSAYFVLSRAGALDTVNRFLNVYTEDITDSIFDRNQVFTNPGNSQINAIYQTEIKISSEYTAQEVNAEGIYIPRT